MKNHLYANLHRYLTLVLVLMLLASCGLLGAAGEENGALAGEHAARGVQSAAEGDWPGAITQASLALVAIAGLYGTHRYTVRTVNKQRDAKRVARNEAV